MIKKLTCLVAIILLSGVCANAKKKISPEVDKAKEVVWAGLDYSMVKMIGTADFRKPAEIFPGMPIAWNGLFSKEVLPKLGSKLKKEIVEDTGSVTELNKLATAAQIEARDGTEKETVDMTHITDAMLGAEVKKYKLAETSGVGLVFIVDRLVKAHNQACLFSVWFDVGTREVLDAKRGCYKVGGIGFRNFWFTPVKRAVKEL